MTLRTGFEQELKQLKAKVWEMGAYAEIGLNKLSQAVRENDREALEQLSKNSHYIVNMQRSIESECLVLMTKQQPVVAGDLRLVSATLKVVTELERIGDHVADMAELFRRRNGTVGEKPGDGLLLQMLEEACKMFRQAVDAFAEGSEEIARMVVETDDRVDDMFNQVKDKMMEVIRTQSLDADSVVDNLMLSKYLEKVGDHAVNIAEWTLFRLTGEIGGREIY